MHAYICWRLETSGDIVYLKKIKKTKTRFIWKWFGFALLDDLQLSSCCKICKISVPNKDSSTTNLFQHLKETQAGVEGVYCVEGLQNSNQIPQGHRNICRQSWQINFHVVSYMRAQITSGKEFLKSTVLTGFAYTKPFLVMINECHVKCQMVTFVYKCFH